jgi:hydroxyacylglutathione hydrolase
MIRVNSFTFNDFAENTYILHDETGECIIVDPGCQRPAEQNELCSAIEKLQLKPVVLLNTHCHIDHIFGNAFLAARYKLPLHLHRDELQTMKETGTWAKLFGLTVDEGPEEKVFINEGDSIRFGNSLLEIFFTPGHSRASLSFYSKPDKIVIAGDVLFRESIGRTDLPGGDYDTLIQSIRTRLFSLDDEYVVYPGHGPSTTIGYEKAHNPFLS